METENRDGYYFSQLLKKETTRLTALVDATEEELKSAGENIPEHVRGMMRVGVGKSKMLLKNKFATFGKLCAENLGLSSDVRYPVTGEDLAGYWDTIVMQIIQVNNIFDEVEASRRNNWTEPTEKNCERKESKVKNETTEVNTVLSYTT